MAAKVFWTRQARQDLRAIRDFIAKDAPKTASAFVGRLRKSVERLRLFPFSGQLVPELGREDIREVICGYYRVIYRAKRDHVDVVAVYHGARLLDDSIIDDQT